MKTPHTNDRALRREQGYVLVVLLSVILPLVAITAAITLLLTSRGNHARDEMIEEQLLAAAESAAFQGLAAMNKGLDVSLLPLAAANLQHAQDGIDNDGDGQVDEPDEIGQVRVVLSWKNDRIDNDADGYVDEDDEDVQCLVVDHLRDQDGIDNDGDGQTDENDENYMLTLQGIARPFFGSSQTAPGRVHVYAQYNRALLPTAPAALYLGDPNANVSFNGNAFLVNGNDVGPNGAPTGNAMPGIGVEGPTAAIIAELNRNQTDQVIGLGPDPSVYSVSVPNPFGLSTSFIEDWITLYRPFAHYVIHGGGTVTANPQGNDGIDNDGDGSIDEGDESYFGGNDTGMRITYVDGNVHFSGNNSGTGLLLVDGNLEMTGQFQWRGIVVVRGDLRVSGGGSVSKLIEGATFVGADLEEDPVNVTVGGNVTIQYAQFRIDQVSELMGRWRLWAFQEDTRQ